TCDVHNGFVDGVVWYVDVECRAYESRVWIRAGLDEGTVHREACARWSVVTDTEADVRTVIGEVGHIEYGTVDIKSDAISSSREGREHTHCLKSIGVAVGAGQDANRTCIDLDVGPNLMMRAVERAIRKSDACLKKPNLCVRER